MGGRCMPYPIRFGSLLAIIRQHPGLPLAPAGSSFLFRSKLSRFYPYWPSVETKTQKFGIL